MLYSNQNLRRHNKKRGKEALDQLQWGSTQGKNYPPGSGHSLILLLCDPGGIQPHPVCLQPSSPGWGDIPAALGWEVTQAEVAQAVPHGRGRRLWAARGAAETLGDPAQVLTGTTGP